MADKKRLIENIKTVVIVLLLISAFVLLYHTGYYSGAFERLELFLIESSEAAVGNEQSDSEELSFGDSIAMEIAVSREDGGMYGSAWFSERVTEAYSRFSAFLAEALGSSSSPEEISESDWYNALGTDCVYIRYFSPQFLTVLSAQLGTSSALSDDTAAGEFCLCCIGDAVGLFYSSGDSFYYCSTAVSASALRERLEEYDSNGAVFSANDPLLSGIDENRLVLTDFASVPVVNGSGSIKTELIAENVMPLFGINAYTASQYTEAGGTAVYVDGSSILRIAPTGAVEFEAGELSAVTAPGSGLYECIQLGSTLIASSAGKYCGDAEMFLSSAVMTADGCIISFDYSVDGIPVRCGAESAASFTFTGSELTSANINFRSYSISGETEEILPMYQAAAIASGMNSPRLSLAFFDSQSKLECYWVNE